MSSATLRDMLRRTRALTLCGAGGIGKTRLALRLLATVAGDFADGVYRSNWATCGSQT